MQGIGLCIQHAYNVTDNRIEYSEVLIRSYKNREGVENILEYVKETNTFKEFDFDILKYTLEFLSKHPNLEYPIAVNLCPETILINNVGEDIINLINSYKIDKNKIAIEINENSELRNEIAIRNLNVLQDLNILVALDDFGIAQSNLDKLLNFHFDILKLDKLFVDKLRNKDTEYKSKIILRHLKLLANSLNLKVIVEGVESEGQLKILKELGFNYIQGYLLEKPIPLYEYYKE